VEVADSKMQQDDADLVARSKDGDLSAFNLIVQRYQSQVYNVAARILGDRVGAEDIAQETFVSAYKAIGRFRGGSLRAWLLRISSNLCYDQLRASRRRPEQSLDRSLLSPGFSVPSSDPSPEQMALSGELRELIQRAILALPFDQKTTLALVDVQGFSYEEAAEATNVSLGTVKSRLSRARSAVRDTLMTQKELLPERFRQSH
jgi:RNA polymerase sigma-70 factor (ECF subfamily)